MAASNLTIRVGGEGGEGIISTGDMTAKAAARDGFHVLTFKTFPAEIRGGYAMYQICMSEQEIHSQGDGFHILIVFNKDALDTNRSSLRAGNVLVWDGPGGDIDELGDIPEGVTVYNVPMSKIAKEELKNYRAKNMVALGAISELFSLPIGRIKELIQAKFENKGEAVLKGNFIGFDAGRDYVKNNITKTDDYKMVDLGAEKDTLLISGNEAVGLGALVAGCRFFSAYPITPATEVAIWLAKYLPKVNGTLVQAEDEIASLANVIGASFAGAKSMTATSGPGLSLMQELLGLSSISETALVIANVQRGGPSTGLPTKHEQSDLFSAALGGHGDGTRIVLSPENVQECFSLTIEAFNLAERYQVPVILLSDGSLGMRTETIHRPDLSKITTVEREKASESDAESFNRYEFTDSNISPVSVPGQKGLAYKATGLEHAISGSPNTKPENRVKMMEKRFKKLDDIEEFFPQTQIDKDDGAELGLVSFGSTQGAVKDAVKVLRERGHKIASFYPKLLFPFPVNAFKKFNEGLKQVVVPEINYQGQLAEIISAKTGVTPVKYNIYAGFPFNPCDIVNRIEELLS
ncbi:MAG: 2-oxoacid:acceptor oxidoreductase subunit alpha [Nitrospinota bacterium]